MTKKQKKFILAYQLYRTIGPLVISSRLFVLGMLIQQTCLKLLNDLKAKEIYSGISAHGHYYVISSPFVVSSA